MLRPLSIGDLGTATAVLVHLGRFLPEDHFNTAFEILAGKFSGSTSIADTALGSRAFASLPDTLRAYGSRTTAVRSG
jgi:hypothetical protein